MDMKYERRETEKAITEILQSPDFVHYSKKEEIIVTSKEYIAFMKKHGMVTCVNIKTLERFDIPKGKDFEGLFGTLDVTAS